MCRRAAPSTSAQQRTRDGAAGTAGWTASAGEGPAGQGGQQAGEEDHRQKVGQGLLHEKSGGAGEPAPPPDGHDGPGVEEVEDQGEGPQLRPPGQVQGLEEPEEEPQGQWEGEIHGAVPGQPAKVDQQPLPQQEDQGPRRAAA